MVKAKDLISVFRPKRWYQNIIVIIGALLALELLNLSATVNWKNIFLAFVAICLVASANYGINEVLDAGSDKNHPEKKHRAVAAGRILKSTAIILSIIIYLAGFVIIFQLTNWRAGAILFLFFFRSNTL